MTRQQNLWHHMTWPGREEVMVEPTTGFQVIMVITVVRIMHVDINYSDDMPSHTFHNSIFFLKK